MAHTEFEFLKRSVEAAKQALGEARIRLRQAQLYPWLPIARPEVPFFVHVRYPQIDT